MRVQPPTLVPHRPNSSATVRRRPFARRAGEREAWTYFLTYHTYGTWLHGDERRSVDRRHNIPETETLSPDPGRLAAARELLKHEPTLLDTRRRQIVEATIREVCAHRGWHLHAVNVRTNHVHVVITARCPREGPDRPEGVGNPAPGRSEHRTARNPGVVAPRQHAISLDREGYRGGVPLCGGMPRDRASEGGEMR